MNNSAPRKRLPVHPSIEHLQKQAKRLAKQNPKFKLAEAQHQLARDYGCKNWAELAHVVETMRRGGDQLANVQKEFEPLPKAARQADLEQVRLILQAGSFTQHDLDQGLAHALWYEEHGTWEERKALADLLLAHGADPDGQYGSNYGPIVFGTGECLHPDGLQYLIDAGADVTFARIQTKYGWVCPLDCVLGTYARGRNGRKHRMIDLLLRNNAHIPPEVTAPVLAIHRGDAGKLEELLEKDPNLVRQRFPDMPYGNIELKGASLLHCAVEFGEVECLEVLFNRVADINIKAEIIDGIGGQTPIFHAINTNADGNFPVLEYLAKRVEPWIDMSIRATWRDSGNGIQSKPMTPLEYAEHAAKGEGSKWRKKIDEELAILRSLDHTEQIKAALLRKDAGMAGRLLDRRPDLLKPMLWPTAVFQAKSLELTRLLLDRGLNPDECTAPRKPLHLAVYQCLPDIVELLIERGADVNLRNPLDETPLDLLDAYEPRPVGDPDAQRIRRALREAGAKDDFYTVIRAGEAVRVRAMLEADPALAKADSSLGGPLFVASRSGRAEVVSVLLEFGADPNKVNSKGNTPLWFAAQSPAKPASSRIAVMKLLLEAGADLNHRCENGTTALHFAAWRGPAEVVEFLLFQGAKNWITDDNGKTPLDHAREMSVAEDKEAIIALLNQPRIKDPHFRAAVTALTNGDLAGLQRLLHDHPHLATAQAEENGEFAGPYFSRPYLLEFVPENPIRTRKLPANVCAIAQALIDAGSPKAALDKTLKLAASGCVPRECGVQAELLELLVQNGADPAVGLEGAVSQGEEGAAALLLRLGAVPGLVAAAGLGDSPRVRGLIPAASPREKERALNAAFRYARKETAEALLDSGIPLDREILDFGTPLHHAASFGHEALCQWLIERGADPAAKDSQWEGTPAGWAAHHGHPGLSAFLQQAEAGGKAMAKPAGDLDRQVVQAVLTNDLSTLQRLLEAHPEKRALTGGQWNKPLLHCAAWEGHLPMVRELLRRGADVNARCESDQACAVHFAAEKGHLEIVRVLAEAGADLEAPDNDHQLNVLGWATALGKCQMEVARFLLARGARQTIWSAVSLNDAEAVRALVQADPGLLQARMSRNEYFRTPLHQAVHAEQPEMVRLLLELGADPGAKDAMGLGPIGAGATVPDAEILAMLEDPEREPALYDALVLGRFEEAEKLLARDPGCLKAGGSEARLLVYAVSRKNGPMAEWLAAHGCDINAVAEVYQCPATALHFAVEQGNLDRIRWLLDLGADPSIRDGKYDADALGWAEFFGNAEAADLIRSRRVTPTDKKKGGVS